MWHSQLCRHSKMCRFDKINDMHIVSIIIPAKFTAVFQSNPCVVYWCGCELEWCFCFGSVLFSSWVLELFLSSITCSNELNIIYKIHHCQQVLIYLGGEASLTDLSLLPVPCHFPHVSITLIFHIVMYWYLNIYKSL